MICADAGYGKTTILSELLSDLKFPYLYYQIDEKDRDLAVFLTYLSSGITRLYLHFGTKAADSFRQTRNIEASAAAFVNDIVDKIGQPIYLVFDDYQHLIEYRDINQFMNFLLDHGPDFLHVIISTRVAPHFSLTKLIAKQEYLEISRENLRFAREEIEMLFKKLSGISLSNEELTRLDEYSEGWITALRLIIQDLLAKGRKDASEVLNEYLRSGQSLFNYFAKEILDGERPRIRNLLLTSSILEQMDTKNCSFILGIKNPQTILSYITLKHLFVTRLDAGTYQYHRLFKEFLKRRLTIHYGAKSVRQLHHRAGMYYLRENDPAQAVEHFIAAERYHDAVRTIRKSADKLLNDGMFFMLYTWIEGLPLPVLKRNYDIYFMKAKILRLWGRWDEALEIFDEVYTAYKKKANRRGCALALNEKAMIFHYRGNAQEALRIEKKACRYIPKHDYLLLIKIYHSISVISQAMGQLASAEKYMLEAREISQKTLGARENIQIACGLAFIYSIRGEFKKAAEILNQLIKEYQAQALMLPWMGNVYGNAASIAMDLGEFTDARAYLERAEEICRKFNDRRSLAYLIGARGQLHFCKGDYKQATKYYERTMLANQSLKERRIDFVARIDLSAAYLASGNPALAKKYHDQAKNFVNFQSPSIDFLTFTILEAQLARPTQNLNKALSSFRKALTIAQQLNVTFYETRILFYLAQLLIRKGESLKARRTVRECLRLAEAKGYEFFLISESKKDPTVLEFADQQKINPAYVDSLLSVLGKTPATGLGKIGKEGDLLKIKFFGGLELFNSEGKKLEVNWPSQKVKSLFCFLTVQTPKKFTKDHLIEIFWPEKPRDRAEQNLYTNISLLRKLLKEKICGEVVQHRGQFYYLNPDFRFGSDFTELMEKIKAANSERNPAGRIDYYLKIAEFHPDDFLPEIYDNWCVSIKDFLNKEYLNCLRRLGSTFWHKKDYENSLEYFLKSAKLDPFDEVTHQNIMRCYAELGNQKMLNEHYQNFKTSIKKEFNKNPQLETTRLYQELVK